MCGLAGYVGKGDKDILEKMTRSLKYRGPNDKGFFIQDGIGLGHQRLSIIDLSDKGRQPISNEDEKIKVVFNGEIYNFQELRKDLILQGHMDLIRIEDKQKFLKRMHALHMKAIEGKKNE